MRFEPPAHDAYRRPETLQAFADVLRGRPGEWALLGRFSTSGAARQAAYQMRSPRDPKDQAIAPAGSFKAEARTLCSEYRVYVVFAGDAGVARAGQTGGAAA